MAINVQNKKLLCVRKWQMLKSKKVCTICAQINVESINPDFVFLYMRIRNTNLHFRNTDLHVTSAKCRFTYEFSRKFG